MTERVTERQRKRETGSKREEGRKEGRKREGNVNVYVSPSFINVQWPYGIISIC